MLDQSQWGALVRPKRASTYIIASAYINLSWLHSSELESCPFVKLHLNNETAGFVDAQSRDIGHECEQ
jgi:hypothetical protein